MKRFHGLLDYGEGRTVARQPLYLYKKEGCKERELVIVGYKTRPVICSSWTMVNVELWAMVYQATSISQLRKKEEKVVWGES